MNWRLKMSQKKLVKKHLQSGQPITSWEAIEKWNCTRLASVINVLKNEGMNIKSEMKPNPSNGKRFAVYTSQRVEDKNQTNLFGNITPTNTEWRKRWEP